jgi:hypothetical protein
VLAPPVLAPPVLAPPVLVPPEAVPPSAPEPPVALPDEPPSALPALPPVERFPPCPPLPDAEPPLAGSPASASRSRKFDPDDPPQAIGNARPRRKLLKSFCTIPAHWVVGE